jgi:transcription initiation factor TFIIIB Brf1 subunit/transcription initiation factor TFIIB
MSGLRRISSDEVSAVAQTVWLDRLIADTIASEASQIINQTYTRKFAFFNGKSSRCLVGGLFYLLGFRYDAIKKQNELADRLGTTDVTIRLSYRRWLETFPDLFLDVINKFAADKDLRFFVLLDLKEGMIKSETIKTDIALRSS